MKPLDPEIAALLKELTVEEKVGLLSGADFWRTKAVERLGIPSILMTDGPHGLRKQAAGTDNLGLNESIPATCFPPAATLANSWDTELLEEVGQALGKEAAAEDISIVLGPGLNLKRSPLGGRNFEYFSEDPYLSGKLAAAMIKGIQSEGVGACPKHFAVNSQELHRSGVDEVVDERALHELYLEGFRRAVTEGKPWFIMSSYNKVNGIYAHENPELLQDILRDQWGFDGVVVSDWGGNSDSVRAVQAGGTLEMPSTSGETQEDLLAALASGDLEQADVDARVQELLHAVLKAQLRSGGAAPDFDSHHRLAVRAAAESAVLLENNGVLPLKTGTRIAVVGDFAEDMRYQGAGSSLVNPTRLDSPLEALDAAGLNIVGYAPGFKRLRGRSARLRREAINLAATAEVTLLFLGLDEAAESEGRDRRHMHLAPAQLELTRDLLHLGVPVVVVLAGGSPVELPFARHVSALVHGYLGGQGGGEAIVKVLTGEVNPGGKLAESYALHYADSPAAPWYLQTDASAEHRESIYVGYRYYDKVGAPVRYPFGFGRSYTEFSYDQLSVSETGANVTVTNTGTVRGTEVVQVYVAPPGADEGFAAPQQLKGFGRITLDPGETGTVCTAFDGHTFAHYDAHTHSWQVVSGVHQVSAGASSRDIHLRAPITVTGQGKPEEVFAGSDNYVRGTVQEVAGEEFSRLLGKPLPPTAWDPEAPLGPDALIVQSAQRSWLGKTTLGVIEGVRKFLMLRGDPITANYTYFITDLPFRALSRMSGGRVSRPVREGITKMFDGQTGAGWQEIRRARMATKSERN